MGIGSADFKPRLLPNVSLHGRGTTTNRQGNTINIDRRCGPLRDRIMRGAIMKSVFTIAVLSAAIAFGCAGNAAVKPSDPSVTAVAQMQMAYQVADYARRTNDATAMVVAARMLAEVPTRTAAIKGTLKGGRASDKQAKPAVTVASLLAEAEILAHGDPSVLAEIARLRGAAARGQSFQPVPEADVRIPARSSYSWEGVAHAGQELIIAAIGDGDTDIDLMVYDAKGRLICQDNNIGYYPVCRFTPLWNGRFRVVVLNRGDVYSDTMLRFN
jgi:hypothetical protein